MVPPVGQINNANNGGASAPQRKELDKVSSTLRNYISLPVSGFSATVGVLSFVMPNVFKQENDILDTTANYSAKAAVLANSIYAGYDNLLNKNTIGALGYSVDFIASIISPSEDIYQWRGIANFFDQGPAILDEISDRLDEYSSLKKRFNPENDKSYAFSTYPNFLDNTKKSIFGIKEVVKGIFSGFTKELNEKGFKKAFIATFLDKAENNLLLSGLGTFIGGIGYLAFGFKKLGATFRDLFGFYADFAVYHKGHIEKEEDGTNKKEAQGDFAYRTSGMLFTLSTIFDVIYRWTEIKNMHLLGLGMDRLAAFFMADGNVNDNTEDATTDNWKLVTAAN